MNLDQVTVMLNEQCAGFIGVVVCFLAGVREMPLPNLPPYFQELHEQVHFRGLNCFILCCTAVLTYSNGSYLGRYLIPSPVSKTSFSFFVGRNSEIVNFSRH